MAQSCQQRDWLSREGLPVPSVPLGTAPTGKVRSKPQPYPREPVQQNDPQWRELPLLRMVRSRGSVAIRGKDRCGFLLSGRRPPEGDTWDPSWLVAFWFCHLLPYKYPALLHTQNTWWGTNTLATVSTSGSQYVSVFWEGLCSSDLLPDNPLRWGRQKSYTLQ